MPNRFLISRGEGDRLLLPPPYGRPCLHIALKPRLSNSLTNENYLLSFFLDSVLITTPCLIFLKASQVIPHQCVAGHHHSITSPSSFKGILYQLHNNNVSPTSHHSSTPSPQSHMVSGKWAPTEKFVRGEGLASPNKASHKEKKRPSIKRKKTPHIEKKAHKNKKRPPTQRNYSYFPGGGERLLLPFLQAPMHWHYLVRSLLRQKLSSINANKSALRNVIQTSNPPTSATVMQ